MELDDLGLPTLDELQQSFWQDIQTRRDQLLYEADAEITRREHNGLNTKEWRLYRRKIRDIMHEFEEPLAVRWPPKPNSV